MQAVIAIPSFATPIGKQKMSKLLTRPVAGVPLMQRVVLTASGAGATDILLICHEALSLALPQDFLRDKDQIRVIQFGKFDPRDSLSWSMLDAHLDDEFLWVPSWVTAKQFLKDLPLSNRSSVDWSKPAHVALYDADRNDPPAALPSVAQGVEVTPSAESSQRLSVFSSLIPGKFWMDFIHLLTGGSTVHL